MATSTCKADISPTSPSSESQHRLHLLIHTVRCIAGHEDQLCTLLHASRKSPRLTAAVRRELGKVLDSMPAHDYLHDLEAVRELLASGTAAPSR